MGSHTQFSNKQYPFHLLVIWFLRFAIYSSLPAGTFLLRSHPRHQRAIREWKTTPSHNKTPTNPRPAPAEASMAKAARLYTTIAKTSPAVARLSRSRDASQQATPNVISAAPVSLPTVNAAGASSVAPNRSVAATDGNTKKTNPAPASTIAVTISRFFLSAPLPRLFGLSCLGIAKDVTGRFRPVGCE